MDRWILTPFSLDQAQPALMRLARPGATIHQPTFAGPTQMKRLAAIHAGLVMHVERALRAGERPVAVSGDCCAAIPVITGLQRAGRSPQVLWLDAHGDFNTPQTSPSGFLGGMPLAMLTGRGELTMLQALGTAPLVDSAVTLCDARDLDPLEREALDASKVTRLRHVKELDTWDPGPGHLHVHFDPDIVDPEDAPAMLYRADLGPRAAVLDDALRRLARRVSIGSVSFTTWALDRDSDRRTEGVALKLLDALLNPGRQVR